LGRTAKLSGPLFFARPVPVSNSPNAAAGTFPLTEIRISNGQRGVNERTPKAAVLGNGVENG
jgi:hypothetical protein